MVSGWEAGTNRALEHLAALDREGRATAPELIVRNWHHVPLLTWYAPDVSVKNLFDDLNPYNVMNGTADHSTWGILVYPRDSDEPRVENLARDWRCTPFDALPVYHGRSLVQTFHYYECESRLPPP